MKLELRNVSVRYGRTRALESCSLRVPAGGAVALLGANGAGKTTLLRTVSGLVRLDRGRILLDGARIDGMPPHAVVRLGAGHVPEGRALFPNLSVVDNLRLGGYTRSRADVSDGLGRVLELFPRLAERAQVRAGSLSGGEQQMLAIGRALVMQPKLLLLDEISLGLAPLITQELYETLAGVRAAGVSMLIVEQHVAVALAHTDHAYVLRKGEVVLAGPSRQLAADMGLLWQAYLGAENESAPVRSGGAGRAARPGREGIRFRFRLPVGAPGLARGAIPVRANGRAGGGTEPRTTAGVSGSDLGNGDGRNGVEMTRGFKE
jgi:branched-chain amino acid transport system ATP-binding protein